MSLNRLTKDQLVKRLKEEEKHSAQLEIDLEDARRRLSAMEQTAHEALQTARTASRTVETFRYIQEGSDKTESYFSQALEAMTELHRKVLAASKVRGRVITNLRAMIDPVIICPRCGAVEVSDEPNILLCERCFGECATN